MPSLWFLEIVCAASFVTCVMDPSPTTPFPRYYKTEADCIRAIIVLDKVWMSVPNTATKFNSLPIIEHNRG